jgi:tRNA (guanine-N7-)-methyltransferase
MARPSRLPAQQLQPYLWNLPHPRTPAWRELARQPPKISWTDLFGNENPVEIEVGFGKGLFLLTQSQAHPQVNFLGIEIERKFVMLTAARLARSGVRNVRLACTDARWLLHGVADRTVQAVHVYFPDPWWKERHRKRKLFTTDFADQCVRVLWPAGLLHFATDVAEYFAEACAMLDAQPLLTRAADASSSGEEGLTHFERKYRREGRAIHRTCYLRV